MSRSKSAMVAIAIGLFAVGSIAPASGSVGDVTDARQPDTPRWSVALRGEHACTECASGRAFDFEARRLPDGEAFVLRLANLTNQVRSYEVVGSRLVVFGELSVPGDAITVYDLAGRQLDDEWLGYGAALSPGRRYIAFRRFYPRFAPAEVRGDVLLVYDLTRSAADNRVAGERSRAAAENAGWPVFPPANVKTSRIETQSGGSYWVHARYGWSRDDAHLALVAEAHDSGTPVVAVATLRFGLQHIALCTRTLEREEYMREPGAKPERLVPDRIEFDQAGSLHVKPYPIGSIRGEVVIEGLTRCQDPVEGGAR